MQFEEVKKELETISFITIRQNSEDYFEGVISQSQIPLLNLKISKFFGPPVWPSKDKLPIEIINIMAPFGGIMSDQTLYFHKQTDEVIFLMLWPWQDGIRATIKMARKKI